MRQSLSLLNEHDHSELQDTKEMFDVLGRLKIVWDRVSSLNDNAVMKVDLRCILHGI